MICLFWIVPVGDRAIIVFFCGGGRCQVFVDLLFWDLKSIHDAFSADDGERESLTGGGAAVDEFCWFLSVDIDTAMSIIVLTNSLAYPKGIKTPQTTTTLLSLHTTDISRRIKRRR
mmetsp:Transcript_55749/g.67004  ORF Transcript_55749/g.67004 Transcript_55749/m.67004 type:complete len:116 (-) Transcript_55749:297-644(-)